MAAILEIDDGVAAWWESPDIWVVPGSDPLAAPGAPIAGEPAYVWARVHNRGDVDVQSARVDFWWSNPTTGVTRPLSTLIGSAFVDVAAGGTEEVVCLSAWVPVFVNGGHECLVAEVISTADPLPAPPPDPFDPPNHHQIAQRNLSVLAAAQMVMSLQLGVGARDEHRRVALRVEIGGELDAEALATLGLAKWRPADEHLVTAGLSNSASCDAKAVDELVLPVERGKVAGAHVHVRAKTRGAKGTYTVVRVRQDKAEHAPGITYVALGGGSDG